MSEWENAKVNKGIPIRWKDKILFDMVVGLDIERLRI